jgi:hypothetical protein
MRKFFFTLAALAALASCTALKEEWQPVYRLTYPDPSPYSMYFGGVPEMTIAELKALYTQPGTPVEIPDGIWIKGQVISSDKAGNVYRELYIQDETGGIDVKIGKTSLYSDYQLGQWIYVDCGGLVLGQYNGMPQLGLEDPTGEYETSYIDVQPKIDMHIRRGPRATPVAPKVIDREEDLTKDENIGRFVTLKGLRYGAATSYTDEKFKRMFCLVYIDQNKDKKASSNRVFLSDETYNVTTWAMSKNNFLAHLDAGDFDGAETGDGKPFKEVKETVRENATALTISQYFSMGNTSVQIRSSGYSRFCDAEIDPAILGDKDARTFDGAAIDVTGILTIYNGAAQFTLVEDPRDDNVKYPSVVIRN